MNATSPGPGAYTPVNFFRETPKYSLNRSRLEDEKSCSPGPGAYNPDKNVVKKRPQSAKIGRSLRGEKNITGVPGPGSYYLKPRPSTPCLSFTK